MRSFIFACVAGLWAATAVAQDLPRAEVQGVIDGQMTAFKADDFETAFGFASPMIQGMFRNPSNFGAMVQQGYPMVWRPADVQYGPLREVAGRLYQTVIVTDQAGRVHGLEYEMIAVDNTFKINGVRPIQLPEVGA